LLAFLIANIKKQNKTKQNKEKKNKNKNKKKLGRKHKEKEKEKMIHLRETTSSSIPFEKRLATSRST
jgi:hypothetical protein